MNPLPRGEKVNEPEAPPVPRGLQIPPTYKGLTQMAADARSAPPATIPIGRPVIPAQKRDMEVPNLEQPARQGVTAAAGAGAPILLKCFAQPRTGASAPDPAEKPIRDHTPAPSSTAGQHPGETASRPHMAQLYPDRLAFVPLSKIRRNSTLTGTVLLRTPVRSSARPPRIARQMRPLDMRYHHNMSR